MLSNATILSYETTVKVANVSLRPLVSTIIDIKGDHGENTLEWGDITESLTAIIFIDRDFKITYINEEMVTLFGKYQESFRKVWFGFHTTQDWLIKQWIDAFHKNPTHQYQLLFIPLNLPYKTDINIAELTIELNVTAIIDVKSNYISSNLEWRDVTELRDNDKKVGRLASTVERMTTNFMIVHKMIVFSFSILL
ncbi:hypothetical protein [Candidatus Enterovibrio altilux]|uniref:hypothetical protein n=1 Tax=Candidatus Enterovibrio altilux TaxID=1927128 RepID=UPI000BBC8B4E|nr:hypothetical protein [Candidatus Enterovibrio luxaltus]